MNLDDFYEMKTTVIERRPLVMNKDDCYRMKTTVIE